MSAECGAECGASHEGMFPPAGVPDYPTQHDYPTRFSNFHWWGSKKVQSSAEKVCYNKIRRDELPIPPLLDDMWRYPYRYTSAQPAKAERSRLQRAKMLSDPKRVRNTIQAQPKQDLRDVTQAKGYETSSMDASLAPFQYRPPTEIVFQKMPSSLLTPTWAKRCAHTDFGQYVLEQLHPNHRKDPLVRHHIQFTSRDANREACLITRNQIKKERKQQHLDPNPQRQQIKDHFLFVQQRPGHKTANTKGEKRN